jgi:hypothetical protein
VRVRLLSVAFYHTHLVRGGFLMFQPTARARVLARFIIATSYEVGMQNPKGSGTPNRPEPQGPTSHEVGMQKYAVRRHAQ